MKAWIAIGMTLCLLLAGALPVYAAPAEGAEEVYVLSAGEAAALTMDVEVHRRSGHGIRCGDTGQWRRGPSGGSAPDVARRGRRIRGSAGQ